MNVKSAMMSSIFLDKPDSILCCLKVLGHTNLNDLFFTRAFFTQLLSAEAPQLNVVNVKGRKDRMRFVVSRTAGLVFRRAKICYSVLMFSKGKRGALKTRT